MRAIIIYRHTLRRFVRNFGFAILIVGMQIGMFLNLFVANIGWNNILPPLSLLAIANFRNLSRFKFPLMSNNLMAIILFQIIVLLYILYQGYDGPDVLVFTCFVIASYLSFASLNPSQLDFDGIVRVGWWISFVCCILGLYVTTIGAVLVKTIASGNSVVVEGLTIGGSGVTCIMFSLFYKPKKPLLKALVTIALFLGAATIIFSGKRSPLLVGSAMGLLYCFRIKGLTFTQTVKTAFVLLIGVVIVASLFNSEFNIVESFHHSIERTITGVDDMLTGSSKSGISARMRYFAKQWAYDYIDTNFTFLNFVFGAGVMTKWLDVPILQAFLDMGILGFLFYLTYAIVYPIRVIFSRISKNSLILFACCYCLPNIVTMFNSGTPYGMARWIPIGFLLVAVLAVKRSRRINIQQQGVSGNISKYSTTNGLNV